MIREAIEGSPDHWWGHVVGSGVHDAVRFTRAMGPGEPEGAGPCGGDFCRFLPAVPDFGGPWPEATWGDWTDSHDRGNGKGSGRNRG